MHRFPTLAAMARDYLAISATSVPSENVFSSGGRMISDRRHRLIKNTIKKAVLLRSWISNDAYVNEDIEDPIADTDTLLL